MEHPPERRRFKAGSLVFSPNDPADAAYLVLSGEVELSRDGTSPRDLEVRRPGEMFGEMAIVNDRPRNAAARAVSDCELLAITRAHVSERIEVADPLLRFCLGALLDRIEATQRGGAGPNSIWTAHAAAARDIISFEHELRDGIAGGQLDLYFQPIVRLAAGRLAGFEALVRWQHPKRGLLQPGDFIPMAEKYGVISSVTTFCLRQVARHLPALQAAASSNLAAVERLFLSVNVSGLDLLQPAFAAHAVSILAEGNVKPEDVRLEITESILLTDAERCARTLEQCRDQGFRIAIDDFGTGYSSLHYLNALPISVLKTDRSFSQALLAEPSGRTILGAILRLGRELGLTVIAEGVESEAQADALRSMDCDFGQGYLFGPAREHGATLQLIRDWRATAFDPAARTMLRA